MIKEIKREHWYSSGDFIFIIWQYFPDAMLSFYKNQSTNFHCKSITWFMVYIATLAKRKKLCCFSLVNRKTWNLGQPFKANSAAI